MRGGRCKDVEKSPAGPGRGEAPGQTRGPWRVDCGLLMRDSSLLLLIIIIIIDAQTSLLLEGVEDRMRLRTRRRLDSDLPLAVGVAFGKRHGMTTRSRDGAASSAPVRCCVVAIVVAHLAPMQMPLMQALLAAMANLVGKNCQEVEEIISRLGRAGPPHPHVQPIPFRRILLNPDMAVEDKATQWAQWTAQFLLQPPCTQQLQLDAAASEIRNVTLPARKRHQGRARNLYYSALKSHGMHSECTSNAWNAYIRACISLHKLRRAVFKY